MGPRLDFEERRFIRTILHDRLGQLSGGAFERFFQDLMCARYPDFIDVRTHGRLGDLGADGLSLHDRKLYACYAPEVPDPVEVRAKFNSDLEKAIAKRKGEFDTFVFVHNDRRGIHPEISAMLTQATREYPHLGFEQINPKKLYTILCQLERDTIEDLLGCQIPVSERVYSIGLDDLEPLLTHLKTRRRATSPTPIREVPPDKLDYNGLCEEDRDDIISSMRYTPLIDEYYAQRSDVTERDEVAQGINSYYREIRETHEDPGEVLWKLQEYVAGNARGSRENERAVMVVLAYFFETCDIFDEPPSSWRRAASKGGVN